MNTKTLLPLNGTPQTQIISVKVSYFDIIHAVNILIGAQGLLKLHIRVDNFHSTSFSMLSLYNYSINRIKI